MTRQLPRLRRALGTLVDTRPYRLAGGVRMSVEVGPVAGLAGTRLVRTSAAPGVRALAHEGRPGQRTR